MDVIGPLSTAPFYRSMLGAPRIPDFEIPNSEFRMAYGPVHMSGT